MTIHVVEQRTQRYGIVPHTKLPQFTLYYTAYIHVANIIVVISLHGFINIPKLMIH